VVGLEARDSQGLALILALNLPLAQRYGGRFPPSAPKYDSTMKNPTTLRAAAATSAAITLALAGCTSQQLWRSGQQWQKQECARLKDIDERKRCERSAATSYEQFQAESAGNAKKSAP
jgi:hypothetical protein